jgi:hypothetical protein
MYASLENFLEAADGAGKVLAHAKLLVKLARIYQELAPTHLGQSSKLANYKSGTIVIHAVSGAVAAKLRQMAPTLAAGFSKRGVECNDVQVKVQAREFGTQSRTSTLKPLTSASSHSLESLRDTLPSSPLRDALNTLLTRSARADKVA